MIEVKSISKSYGKNIALKVISFDIEVGDIVGFIGPNGAGKTTTMNILTGCIAPTGGDVIVDGKSILTQRSEAIANIGYLPELPPIYTTFTVEEFLSTAYEIKCLKMKNKTTHIKEVAKVAGIEDVINRRTGNLSKGYRQRVGIAYALLGNPKYIILDEPTAGLDPKQKYDMLMFVKKLRKHCGVLLSSHILSEIESVCNRVIMIDRGKILKSMDISLKTSDSTELIYKIDGEKSKILNLKNTLTDVDDIKHIGDRAYVVRLSKNGVAELFYALAKNGCVILQQQPYTVDIEKMFLDSIGGSNGSDI